MNTTFTNYATKAKQFLNLLQGYTKGIRMTAILILLLMGVNNAWAWNPVYLIGAPTNDNWSANQKTYVISNGADEGSAYFYFAKNCSFAVYIAWYNEQAGPSEDGAEMSTEKGAQKFYIWDNGQNSNAAKYVGNSGIIEVHAKQKDNGDDKPWIWLTRPEIKIKHNWNGNGWAEQTMDDNGDGTYSYIGQYSGDNQINFGLGSSGATMKYITNATLVGSPSKGDKCLFTYNSFGYKGYGGETENAGSATITKLCTITYNGNGKTGGTVPNAESDKLYNTSITLSSNTLTKDGYTHTGWNTKADGSGDHYDKGASYTLTEVSTTLYAEWTPTAPTITISTEKTYLRTSYDKLTLNIDYSNIPEGHYYRVHATPEAYFNGNENGDDVYKVEIKGTKQTHFISHGYLSENTYTVELILLKGETPTGIKSNQITITVEPQLSVQTRARFNNQINTTAAEHPQPEWVYPSQNVGETITASEPKPGYTFAGWTANDDNLIKFDNPNSLTTIVTSKVKGNNNAVAYANYTKENCVYFVNTSNWSSVYAYACYGSGDNVVKNANWPGEKMTKTDETIGGYDVYKYCEPYAKIVFTCGNDGCKTGDLVWEDGKYYSSIGVHGNFSGEWNTECFESFSADGTSASLTLDINQHDGYEFGLKLPDWRSNGGNTTFTRANKSQNVTGTDGNMKFNADVTGEYTFTWTFTTNTLTITYPTLSSYTVDFNMKGHGDATESQTIEQGGKVTKPADPTAEGFTFGGWYTDAECTNQYDFNTTVSSSFTLYAKWIQQYVIVGNGNGSWLSGHSWIGDGTVTTDNNNIIQGAKTYKACPAGLKNFRIVPWGVNSWGQEHGFDQIDREKSSKIPYYTNEDNNIAFVTVAKADITIRFDVANNKITIEVNYNCEGADLETVKSSIASGKNVMFYFGDEITAEDQRKTDYKYVNDNELVNGVINHRVTEAKGFRLQGVGNDKWLAVAILPPNIYRISNNPTWDGVSTDEAVQAGAIYAWYGEKVKRKIDGVTPTWNNPAVSVKVKTNASGLTATASNSSVNREQTITDYYYQLEGESTWTKFDPTDVSDLPVGIYEVHALACDGNIYVRTAEPATLTIYDEYTINYKDQGGSAFSGAHEGGYPTTHTYGTATTLKSATKAGYTFVGWFTDSNCSGTAVTSLAATAYTADITLYAKFEKRDLYIHTDIIGWETTALMTQDGTNKAVYTYTTTLEPKAGSQTSPYNDGYHFHFVNTPTNPNGNIAYNWDRIQTPTGTNIDGPHLTDPGNPTIQFGLTRKSDVTITLTLQSPNDDPKPTVNIAATPYYNITLDQANATSQSNPTSVEVKWNTEMPRLTAIPTRTGYTFGGYYVDINDEDTKYYDAEGTSAKNWDKEDDVTLYAKWTATPYTITYNTNGGNAIAKGSYTIETEVTLPTPTKTGSTFAGWYDNSEFKGEAITTIASGSTGNKEFWAKWNIGTYAVTLDMEGGNGGTASVNVAYGAAMPTITIPTKDDHLFDGYYDGDNGTGTKYYNADGTSAKNWDKETATLYARWIPYTQCIFFKNTLGWKNVYVYTFTDNAWWNDGTGVHPGTNKLEQGQMTKIGQTDVYYYILTNLTFSHIAFSDFDMRTYGFFNDNKAIYRSDRSNQLQLFIPKTDQKPTTVQHSKNQYYSSGIWMKYNSTESGYDWRGATREDEKDSGWSNAFNFTASKPGGYTFKASVTFNSIDQHFFKIHNIKDDWFGNGGIMTQNNCTNWTFGAENGENAKITPTVTGTYIFTIYLGDGEVSVSLDYPLSEGDYRLAYKDKTENSHHPGHYLKKRSTSQTDTVSFFIHHQDQKPEIIVEKCTNITDGKPTWAKVVEITNNPAESINESGVYNFFLQQEEGNTLPTLVNKAMPYTGSFYIRTDAADGGWDSFRQKSNEITYSSFADTHSNFNHYYCKYIDAGRNVKFTIANDYSYCISDTLDNDDIIKKGQSSIGCLPINANVRFGWDSNTNEISRAYIKGAGMTSDRFLVLQGKDSNLKDANGNVITKGTGNRTGLEANEEILVDQQNWIYQVDVTANKDTKVKLIAEYNGTTQYFKGNEKEYKGLLSSTAANSYKIRLVYDFKSNHLVAAMVLGGGKEVTEDDALGTDMMVIRKDQKQAEQLTFNPNTQKLSDVGTVYAVMTFTSDWINGSATTRERSLYWVSFPFDVKISDVFGFGEYAEHWIMQYYDGAERAEKGLFIDSGTYWKYIEDTKTTLKAGQGYVLALDLSKVEFLHGANEVSLYFPSTEPVESISGDLSTPATVPAHECNIDREWTEGTTTYFHKYTDSHWNLIGVPGFADIDFDLAKTGYHFMQNDASFYYNFNLAESTYAVEASHVTEFQAMYAYMVQFAGTINWTSSEVSGVARPELVAPRNSDAEPEKVVLRLEIAQGEEKADQTFVQLQQEGATSEFDMNLDLTKIINSGANIYTLAGEYSIQTAGNALPMEEAVVPVGVDIATAGEYTFRMPDGTEDMVVELIDYETNTRTNLLLSDYIVTLPKGTSENRFALHIQPQKDVVTSLENIGEGVNNGEAVNKYLIDGKLIIRTAEGVVFDAQGKRL